MKSGKPRRLTKLRINEISLVDRGAGRGVHIALAKRDSHPGPVKEATVKYLKKIMKSLNRAVVDSGEILPPYTREQLYEAVVKTACKEVDAPTEAIAFSRYLERHPELRRLIDNAPAGPPAQVTKTDTSVQGFRDGADPVIEEQTPKAIRAVAQGLVDLGMFDSVSTAIKHMRTSPRYAALFTAPARYRDSVGEILAVPR